VKISKELKVGVFMVVAITVLYLGFNYLKGIDFFSSNDKYYAIYENVDGLNASNPVFINGFTVGRVSNIRLLQKNSGKILVEIDINGDIIIGDSAVATLNSDFLGNKSILLTPGDISNPKQPGDTLLARLDKGIADILAESAQPVANNLEATIKKINAILDNLNGNGEKINRMMDNFEKTPIILNSTIVKTQEDIQKLSETYTKVGEELNKTLAQARPMLRNISQFTDSLKRLELQKTLNNVNEAVAGLNEAINHFTKNEGTLGRLINEDSLYVNLNRAILNFDSLANHFDEVPKDYFSPLGRKKEKIQKRREKEKAAREQ